MTRLRTLYYPLVRYDCDGVTGDGECLHRYEKDGFGYSVEYYEFDKPWKILKRHGWTNYNLDDWTHHRCGHCNKDIKKGSK